MEQLSKFDNFEFMLNYAHRSLHRGIREATSAPGAKKPPEKGITTDQTKFIQVELSPVLKDTLKYLFNILENVTSVSELRERIDCAKLF